MHSFRSAIKTLARWLRALSPTCRDASRLQSEALDRPLRTPQRIGLRIHLFLCRWCRRYGSQLRFLRQAAQKSPHPLPDPAPNDLLSSEARERMQRLLRSEHD